MRVLMVVAPSDFRDEEYFDAKKEIEGAGIKVVTASTSKGEATGMLSGKAEIDLAVAEARAEDYAAVVFVGGSGVEKHGLPENQKILELAKRAKIAAAICIAPRILAKAGIVKGKKATSFPDAKTKKMLEQAGAIYTGKSVEEDGNLITADGPKSARDFGRKIAEKAGGKR